MENVLQFLRIDSMANASIALMIVLFIQMAVSGLRTRITSSDHGPKNSRNSMVSLSFDSIPKIVLFAKSLLA